MKMLKYRREIPTLVWARMKRLGQKLCATKEKRLTEQLVEGRTQIVNLKKALVAEELNEHRLKIVLIKQEMKHKGELNELLMQMMCLKRKDYGDNIAEDRRNKPKERILAEKLAEGKIHIVTLQKTLIDEELHEKKLRVALLQEEMDHKRELYELQKQEMLLKIEEYKANLETMKRSQLNPDERETTEEKN